MRSLGWGLFLATSWTWCIGMFLPVIMLREYGWLGFLVFAVPNVVGCTLFGWAMPPQRGRRLLERGGWLALLFSVVTIAYHLFFVGFASRMLVAEPWRPGQIGAVLLAAGLLAIAWLISCLRTRWWPWLGAVAWSISLLCWLGLSLSSEAGNAGPSESAGAGLFGWGWTGVKPTADLASLAWPMVFGFLWSPWFDLTFHRARREAGSPWAFAVFGAAFALMLLFTATYAAQAGFFQTWIVAHLLVQGTCTVAVHLREAREAGLLGRLGHVVQAGAARSAKDQGPSLRPSTQPGLWRVASVGLWFAATLLGAAMPSEENYLRFLVFYGLFVPALGMLVVVRPTPMSNRRILPLMALMLAACVLEELAFNRGFPGLAWIPFALLWILFMWRPGGLAPGGRRWSADPFRDGLLGPTGR